MVPSSTAVVVTLLLLGAIALGAFVWAWRRGHFTQLDEQARVIFDARDLRLARPWESPAQQAERRRHHGPPESPAPGEWGGSG